jgi:hypothetical protein
MNKYYKMEELIKNWGKRMNAYRLEADTTKSNIQSIKAMHNFITLRDCIKELKQQLILSGVTQCEDIEPTNKTEEIQVSVDKKLFVELYNFAYKQSVKTNTVAELHDIDRRLHGG